MLQPFITTPNGDQYLNSLMRFCLSGLVVPRKENFIVKVPIKVGSNPGQSNVIPLEGPQDAHSILYSLAGAQGLQVLGSGTITTNGADVTGTNTKFLTELQIGDTITVDDGQAKTVLTISSDTILTVSVAFAPDVVDSKFAYTTPVNADVRDRMTVEITDTAWQRRLMNRPVSVQHVFGTAQKPLFLKESTLLEKNQTLTFKFFNNSTAARGSFGFYSEGTKYQMEAMERSDVSAFIAGLRKRKVMCQPYWLTLDDDLTLSASGSATRFFTLTGDLVFVAFNAYALGISSGVAGQTAEKFSVELFDSETDRALQNQPFTLNTGFGDSSNPYVFPSPLIVMPNGQVKGKFTNLITDATTDVLATLFGVAIYTGKSGLTDRSILEEAQRIYNATQPTLIPASPQS